MRIVLTTGESPATRAPQVGVGCIVVRDDRILMVKSHRGYWSTPGGHLDFGESPAECAVRETLEETGIRVANAEFVAVTNDVLTDTGRHYVTIWMRADADDMSEAVIRDVGEIAQVDWFPLNSLPSPLYLYLENLLGGRSMPAFPDNLPDFGRSTQG